MARALIKLLSDIKISHTIFAMPFAILGAFIAGVHEGAVDWGVYGIQLILIVGCMFFARNVAMLANRIIDRRIDSENPRTKQRVIASGEVPVKIATAYLCMNALLFIILTGCFSFWGNTYPLILSVPVLLVLSTYPYLKRFTWFCHIYLGASLALSPVAAAIAIQPEALSHLPIWLLSLAVLCWVAGFDIMYALQDVECDIRDKLKSMPASLGVKPAMLISQILHYLSIAFFFGVSINDTKFGWLFQTAIIFAAMVLIVEHLTVKKWGTTKIAFTFFTLNGIVSLVIGTAGIIDLLC
ncbi:MAG: 4-hydroxybenzoate polyprenyltransferase [Phycisphaerales bacterium]|jgi:4-hydroxybenzoate polyprenyltransferase